MQLVIARTKIEENFFFSRNINEISFRNARNTWDSDITIQFSEHDGRVRQDYARTSSEQGQRQNFVCTRMNFMDSYRHMS